MLRRSLVLLLMCLLVALGACEKGGDAPPPKKTVKGESSPTAGAPSPSAQQLEASAAILPADTLVMGYIDVKGMQSPLVKGVLDMFGPAFSKAQQDALRADLSKFLKERVGLDLLALEWAVLGLSESTMASGPWIILGGEFDLSAMKSQELDGLTVHVFANGEMGLVPIKGMKAALLIPIKDKAKQVALRKQIAETLADPSLALVKGPHIEGFRALFTKETAGSPIAVHARNTEMFQKMLAGEKMLSALAPLQWVSLGIGDRIRLTVKGKPEDIKGLVSLVDTLLSSLESELQSQYKRMDAKTQPEEALAAIMAYHLSGPVKSLLMPKVNGEFARIELSMGSQAALIPVIGVLAAVAIPAFLKYIRDSKTAEAEMNLKAIADGALMYYMEEHQADVDPAQPGTAAYFTGRYPASPTPTCTSTGGAPGQKQVPAASDFNQSPWKELKFEIWSPHYYRYCYESSSPTQFKAWAEASLNSDEIDSVFAIQGAVQTGGGAPKPIIGTINDMSP